MAGVTKWRRESERSAYIRSLPARALRGGWRETAHARGVTPLRCRSLGGAEATPPWRAVKGHRPPLSAGIASAAVLSGIAPPGGPAGSSAVPTERREVGTFRHSTAGLEGTSKIASIQDSVAGRAANH